MAYNVINGKLVSTHPRPPAHRPFNLPAAAKPKPEKDMATKGKYLGLCNRSACLAPGATWWNTGSYAYYCGICAQDINILGCRKFNEPELLHKVTGFNEDGTPQFDPLAKKDYYSEYK